MGLREINRVSKKKQKKIDKLNESPIKVGDIVYIDYKLFHGSVHHKSYENALESCVVLNVDDDGDYIQLRKEDNSVYTDKVVVVKKKDIKSRYTLNVGVNPFTEDERCVRPVNYALESILYNLNVLDEKKSFDDLYEINGIRIKELNWNPYVYINGEKKYYQRDFVWTLEQNQRFIQSIYLGIDLGKILVRIRSWNEVKKIVSSGETEVAFRDIVDGKQRLNALRGFILGEWADFDGNYFQDLSFIAQSKMLNNQLLGYSEMDEDVSDEQVLKQFLKMNFEGVPQSKEHLEYVKSIIGETKK